MATKPAAVFVLRLRHSSGTSTPVKVSACTSRVPPATGCSSKRWRPSKIPRTPTWPHHSNSLSRHDGGDVRPQRELPPYGGDQQGDPQAAALDDLAGGSDHERVPIRIAVEVHQLRPDPLWRGVDHDLAAQGFHGVPLALSNLLRQYLIMLDSARDFSPGRPGASAGSHEGAPQAVVVAVDRQDPVAGVGGGSS